jgi:hypothetical protein
MNETWTPVAHSTGKYTTKWGTAEHTNEGLLSYSWKIGK